MKFVILFVIIYALVFLGINWKGDRLGSRNESSTGQYSRNGSGREPFGYTKRLLNPKRLPRKKLPPPKVEDLRRVLLRIGAKLGGGHISEDISNEALMGIEYLKLSDSDITNEELRVLSLLPKLETLNLDNTQVRDLSPLREFKRLGYLYLNDTQVTDLSPLRELNLQILELNNTQVSDLSPLSELEYLFKLDLINTQVSDLTPLSHLNLNHLNLNNTPVSDLSPLTELKYLYSLHLSYTEISDLLPLSKLDNLEDLYLENTLVSDLGPLMNLKKLERISLIHSNFTENQIEQFKKAVPECSLRFTSVETLK